MGSRLAEIKPAVFSQGNRTGDLYDVPHLEEAWREAAPHYEAEG